MTESGGVTDGAGAGAAPGTAPGPGQGQGQAPEAAGTGSLPAALVPNPYTSPSLDAAARNAALRTLFLTDPHFRRHDGLDVAVDEVAALESSPQARRQTILRARALGLLDDDLTDQDGPDDGPAAGP